MRENAASSIVAVDFLIGGAYTVVVVSACFAFPALSFGEILAEQFRICNCLATWRCRAFAAVVAFAAS